MVRNDTLEYSNQNIAALDVFNINFQNRTSQSDEKYAYSREFGPTGRDIKSEKIFLLVYGHSMGSLVSYYVKK